MFYELLPVSVRYPEKQLNMTLESAVPLAASAESFEECREEVQQIFGAEHIPSILLIYVKFKVPKRTGTTTNPITIPIKL